LLQLKITIKNKISQNSQNPHHSTTYAPSSYPLFAPFPHQIVSLGWYDPL